VSLLALALPAVPLLAIHALFLPMYDLNDDPGMDMLARGVGYADAPTPFLLYSNVLYGRLLNALYAWQPELPWYRLLGLVCQYVAGAVSAAVVLRRAPRASTLALLALYFVAFDATFYLHPTFTVTAASLAIAASVLWLDRAIHGEELPPGETAGFVALVALAAAIRAQSAVLALLVVTPAILTGVVRAAGRRGSVALARGFVPLVAALAAIAALHVHDRRTYAATPGWEDAHTFHRLISEFVDFSRASYTPATRRVFDDVGWSENDFEMLRNWFYADPERYSIANMERVLDAFPRRAFWLESDFSHLALAFGDPYRFAMLGALVAAGLFVPWSGRRWLEPALVLAAAAAVTVGLVFALGRFPPRVYHSVLALLLFVAIVLAARRPAAGRPLRWVRVAALVAFVSVVPGLASTWHGRSQLGRTLNGALTGALRELPREPLYVVWGAALPIELTLPWSSMAELRGLALYSLGSDTRSPLNGARLAERGIDDIYRAIYERDDVRVIGNESQGRLLVRYAQEHYGHRVAFRPVAQHGLPGWHLFSVYRFERIDVP
jgi:hypothetical protein